MRATAVVIAVVLAWLALMPGAPQVHVSSADATPVLRTLDVCHSSSGSMSVDLPCLLCCPAATLPLKLSGAQPPTAEPSKPILLVFRDERPPKPLL